MSGSKPTVSGIRPATTETVSQNGEPQESEGHMSGFDISDEAVIPQQVRNVIQPTQQERDLHNLTHLQFRDWCEDCVKGKST